MADGEGLRNGKYALCGLLTPHRTLASRSRIPSRESRRRVASKSRIALPAQVPAFAQARSHSRIEERLVRITPVGGQARCDCLAIPKRLSRIGDYMARRSRAVLGQSCGAFESGKAHKEDCYGRNESLHCTLQTRLSCLLNPEPKPSVKVPTRCRIRKSPFIMQTGTNRERARSWVNSGGTHDQSQDS